MSSTDKKIEQLRSTIETLQSKLKEKEVEVRRLTVRNALDKDSQRVGHLEKKLDKMKEEFATLEQQVCSLKQERTSLEYEVDLLRNLVDLQACPDEHVAAADAMARCKVLEKDVSLLTTRLRQAEGEVQQRRESETAARRIVDDASEDQRRLVAQVADLSSRLKEFEEESSRYRDEVDQLAAERDEATELMTIMEDTISDLEKHVTNLQEEVGKHKARAEEAVGECEGARRSWSEADRELNTLKCRVAELEAAGSQKALKDEALQKGVETLKDELDSAHRAVEELSVEKKRLLERNASLDDTVKRLEIQVRGKQAEQADLEELRGQLADYQKLERTSRDQLRSMGERVEALQASAKSAKKRYESEIQALEESQASLAKRCEELGHECADKESQMERISHDLKSAVERLADVSMGFGNSSVISASVSPSARSVKRVIHMSNASPLSSNPSPQPSPAPTPYASNPISLGDTSTGRSKAATAKLAQLLNSIGDYSLGTSSGNVSNATEGSSTRGRHSDPFTLSPGNEGGARVAVSLESDTSRGFGDEVAFAHTRRFREVGGGVFPSARIGINDVSASLHVSPLTPRR